MTDRPSFIAKNVVVKNAHTVLTASSDWDINFDNHHYEDIVNAFVLKYKEKVPPEMLKATQFEYGRLEKNFNGSKNEIALEAGKLSGLKSLLLEHGVEVASLAATIVGLLK